MYDAVTDHYKPSDFDPDDSIQKLKRRVRFFFVKKIIPDNMRKNGRSMLKQENERSGSGMKLERNCNYEYVASKM